MPMTSPSRFGRTTAAAAGPTTACRSPRRSRSSASATTPEPEYDFPALTLADLPEIRRWLLEPHVRRWWDDPPNERYPENELEQYEARIRGDADPTLVFLVRHRGRPLGFIQSYLISDDRTYAEALALEAPAAAIDLFIGEPAEVGRGHGPKLIREFLRDVVFARYPVSECVIGPSVKNASAIRAYEKAGFRFVKDAVVPDEPDPEHILRIRRDDL